MIGPSYIFVFISLQVSVHAVRYDWIVDAYDSIDWGKLTACDTDTRKLFDTGYGLASSFMYTNAKELFLEALSLQSDCILSHWGVLFSCWQPLWLSENFEDSSCHQAKDWLFSNIEKGTTREKGLVRALLLYANNTSTPRSHRLHIYIEDMLQLLDDFPTDNEIKLLVSLALATYISPGEWGAADRGADLVTVQHRLLISTYHGMALRLVYDVLSDKPHHPFALHLLIHLQDAPGETANEALQYALSYPLVAPSASHANHMPSHLYLRLGRWSQSIAFNQQAINASLAYIAYLHDDAMSTFYDGHSAQFLHYSFLQEARYIEAADITLTLESCCLKQSININSGLLRVAQTTALAMMENASTALAMLNSDQTLCPQLWRLKDLYKKLQAAHCATCNDARNLDDMWLWSKQTKASTLVALGLCQPKSAGYYAEEIRSLVSSHQSEYSRFELSLEIAAIILDGIELRAHDCQRLAQDALFDAVQKQYALGVSPYGWPVSLPPEEFLAAALLHANNPLKALAVLNSARNTSSIHNANRALELYLHAKATLDSGRIRNACTEFVNLRLQLLSGDSDALLKVATDTIMADSCSSLRPPSGESDHSFLLGSSDKRKRP